MSIDTLFYGLEAFDENVVEDASTDPIQQLEEENTANEAVAEMNYYSKLHNLKLTELTDKLNYAVTCKNYVQKYGANKTFLSLVNRDNRLGNYLNLSLPSAESIDNIGSPYSELSVICTEAFDGIISKIFQTIWKVVCAICKFIFGPFIALWKWIFDTANSPTPKLNTRKFDDDFYQKLSVYMDKHNTSKFSVLSATNKEVSRINDLAKVRIDIIESINDQLDVCQGIIDNPDRHNNEDALGILGEAQRQQLHILSIEPCKITVNKTRNAIEFISIAVEHDVRDLQTGLRDAKEVAKDSFGKYAEVMPDLSANIKAAYKVCKPRIDELLKKYKSIKDTVDKLRSQPIAPNSKLTSSVLTGISQCLRDSNTMLMKLSEKAKGEIAFCKRVDSDIKIINEINAIKV